MIHSTARVLVLLVLLHASVCVLAAAASNRNNSTLVGLVTLTADGWTAPKVDAERICPKQSANLALYDVPLNQLTSRGMQEMAALGAHIRDVYVHQHGFLSPSFMKSSRRNDFEAYFRASWLDRSSQGAVAMSYGLYPPTGSLLAGPPIPVVSQLEQNEHDLAAVRGPCKRTKKNDFKKFAHQRAPHLLWSHRKLLRRISKLCGVDFTEYSYASGGVDQVGSIIDLADMMAADRAHGYSLVEGMTDEMLMELQQLAFQATVERSLSSARRVTYWLGGFADTFLAHLYDMQANSVHSTQPQGTYKYFSYHVQRELALSLQKLLGWETQVESSREARAAPSAMGLTALAPSTTLFFELHASKEDPVAFSIQTFQWTPVSGRRPIRLDICDGDFDCPLQRLEERFHAHFNKTGTWSDVCDFHLVNAPHLKKSNLAMATTANIDVLLYACVVLVSVGFAISAAIRRTSELKTAPEHALHAATRVFR